MLTWIMLAAWMAVALISGYPLARLALTKESRLPVLLSYGLLAGHSLLGVLLILLWGAMPLGQAFYGALAISLSAGLLLLLRSQSARRTSGLVWQASKSETILAWVLIGTFGFLGFRVFSVGYSAWSAEALYWHSGLVSWLQQGTYPPTSPLEPDDPLRYRFGLHALAASVASISGGNPPEVLAATVAALLPLMVLALTGASLRLFNTAGPGLIAAFLGLFGGSLFPLYRFGQLALGTAPSDWREGDLMGGLLFTGNTLDVLHMNVSLAMGFVGFTASVWLGWEAIQSRSRSPFAWAVGYLSLVYLGFLTETHFSLIVVALAMIAGGRFLKATSARDRARQLSSLAPLLLAVAAFLLVSSRGGLLGGISLTEGGPGSLRLALNTAHFGEVVAPPATPHREWYPLLSLDTFVDSNAMVLGLPLLTAAALFSEVGLAALALIAGTAGLALWLTVYPQAAPFDGYRFGQIALVCYLTYAPLALFGLAARVRALGHRLRVAFGVGAVCLVTIVDVVVAFWLIVAPPGPALTTSGSTDVQASRFLSAYPGTSRVLVPVTFDGDYWRKLYDHDAPAQAMRVVLGMSGHAIPLGHQAAYFNPERYRPQYIHASEHFDEESLSALQVDWILALPAYLTTSQRAVLEAKRELGDLTLIRAYGEEGTEEERLLLLRTGNGSRRGGQ